MTLSEKKCLMSFYVYVLQCSDGTYYVGCTNNLNKRLVEHNTSKKGAQYTKIRRPVLLKYFEEFPTLLFARRREVEIKGWRRSKKESLWIKNR
jgi:putative endonuclease